MRRRRSTEHAAVAVLLFCLLAFCLLPAQARAASLRDGSWEYTLSESGTSACLTGYAGQVPESGALTLPASVASVPVASVDLDFGSTAVTAVTVPDGIGTVLHLQGAAIAAVTLPDSVRTVGNGAFGGCAALNGFEAPPFLGLGGTVGSGIFDGCSSLTEGSFRAFSPAAGASSVPTSAVFAGCPALQSVTIPACYTEIAGGSFRNCTGLASVLLPYDAAGDRGMNTVGASAFEGCTAFADDDAADGLFSCALFSVGSRAFAGCTSLGGDLALPASLTALGAGAFAGCSALRSVTLPASLFLQGGSVGPAPFSGSGLQSAAFGPPVSPSSAVTAVPASLFSGCAGLKTAALPDTVQSVGASAFEDCTSLTEVAGRALSSLGANVFLRCSSLTDSGLPQPSAAAGQLFAGWALPGSTDSLTAAQFAAGTSAAAAPRWAVRISFDAGGGSAAEEVLRTPGGVFGALPETERAGYLFSGWYTPAGVKAESGTTVPAAGLILTAHWTACEYTVALDPNGGTVRTGTVTVRYGEQYGSLPPPVRTGYSFLGWFAPAADPQPVTAETIVTALADHTLTARWQADRYTLTFDPNGGSLAEADRQRTVTYDAACGALPETSRTGYTFAGWYTSSSAGSLVTANDIVARTADFTLFAHWNACEYIVALDPNGGTVRTGTVTVRYGEKYGSLPSPARTGYSFLGWFASAADPQPVSSDTLMTALADHTLTARWQANRYTLTFDPNGGNLAETDRQRTVTYDAAYGALPETSRTGYTFAGWYTSSSAGNLVTANDIVARTADFTLFAYWNACEYTVALDPNGGTVRTGTVTVWYGKQYGSIPQPVRTGYSFLGWFAPAADSQPVTAETIVTALADHTLTARWQANRYTLTFDPNGGNLAETDRQRTVTYDAAYGALPETSRTGYTFAGWYTSSSGGSPVTAAGIVGRTSAFTLFAHWTARTYTLTLRTVRLAPVEKTVTYLGSYGALPTPSRTGYRFTGWFTAENGGSLVTASTGVTTPADHVLYSHWSIKDGAEGFVVRLYDGCLDRDPDTEGLADWTNRLKKQLITGSGTAAGFVFSEEFKSRNLCVRDYVKTLYRTFLGREPDSEGFSDWVGRLESGRTREEVFNGFVGSDEFTKLCNSYGITRGDGCEVPQYGTMPTGSCSVCGEPDGVTAFVTRLYSVCLDRGPDAPGLADWTNQLRSHTNTGAGVAYGFIFSPEYQAKDTSNAGYVTRLYKAFFDRDPDAPGYADWLGRLNGGASRRDIFYGFVGSDEFTNLCNKYGIARG